MDKLASPSLKLSLKTADKSAEERGLYPLVPSFDITDDARAKQRKACRCSSAPDRREPPYQPPRTARHRSTATAYRWRLRSQQSGWGSSPTDDAQKLYNFAIMGPGNNYLGYVEALFDNGRPTTLYDIQIEKQNRGTGAATAAVKALLDSAVDGKPDISNIVPSAQGFWERLGIGRQNLKTAQPTATPSPPNPSAPRLPVRTPEQIQAVHASLKAKIAGQLPPSATPR